MTMHLIECFCKLAIKTITKCLSGYATKVLWLFNCWVIASPQPVAIEAVLRPHLVECMSNVYSIVPRSITQGLSVLLIQFLSGVTYLRVCVVHHLTTTCHKVWRQISISDVDCDLCLCFFVQYHNMINTGITLSSILWRCISKFSVYIIYTCTWTY